MKNNLSGQSLFEVVIALAVMSLLIVGLINITTISIRNTSFSRNNTLASRYAGELSEWLRGQRDASWSTFKTNANANGGIYCFDTLSWNGGNCASTETIAGVFYRQATFTCYLNGGTNPGPCSSAAVDTIQAAITVQWTDGQGSHTVSNPVQLTDWRAN